MKRKGNIVKHTAEELDKMIAGGGTKTDWNRVDAMTEEALEASIAKDEDEDLDEWSRKAFSGLPPLPPRKKYIHIGLDEDIVNWFRGKGQGYQTRINAILRAYYEAHRDNQT